MFIMNILIVHGTGLSVDINSTDDTALHHDHAEIQVVAKLHSGELKVGQKLLLMAIVNILDGLQFQDDLVLDDDFGAEPLVEPDSSAMDANGHLTLSAQASLPEFVH